MSNWAVNSGVLNLEVTVPANTTAILKLSDIDLETIKKRILYGKKRKELACTAQKGNDYLACAAVRNLSFFSYYELKRSIKS